MRKYCKTHFSPINLLFSCFEAYIRLRNTGVAACGSFCSLNVKSRESLLSDSRDSILDSILD